MKSIMQNPKKFQKVRFLVGAQVMDTEKYRQVIRFIAPSSKDTADEKMKAGSSVCEDDFKHELVDLTSCSWDDNNQGFHSISPWLMCNHSVRVAKRKRIRRVVWYMQDGVSADQPTSHFHDSLPQYAVRTHLLALQQYCPFP